MDQINSNSQLEVRNNHKVEIWRERLIQDKDALTELIRLYPDVDRQKIRQLIQNTLKEIKASNPSKYYRQLFKYIKEHIV
jgi:ribosome-associated protein